jgi:cytochrome c-type biogenesis protein CcmH
VAAEVATAAAPTVRVRGRHLRLPALSFVALVVVVGIALLIGSGVTSSPPPSSAQRIATLESQIKCPSCEDLSVAQSTTSSAVAVRNQITSMVRAGDPDSQIEAALVARYGQSILLEPSTSGIEGLVWLVPVLGGAVALACLGVLFWRRSRALADLREPGP